MNPPIAHRFTLELAVRHSVFALTAVLVLALSAWAEPVVLKGSMLPGLLYAPLGELFVTDVTGRSIPFQIDEVTEQGEYVCDRGVEPNTKAGNGVLDPQDEIVFLAEDLAAAGSTPAAQSVPGAPRQSVAVTLDSVSGGRTVLVCRSNAPPVAAQGYITYDHVTQDLKTPFYYAQFGKDRFHFTKAGVWDSSKDRYFDLTNELRILIYVRLFWGLVPVTFSEENMVCMVKRYKVGPVRLIRRGDFHLNVGLGIKGSRAAVYQICYPALVSVPVTVHLPVSFTSFFKEAFIEMTPVLRPGTEQFVFTVPQRGVHLALAGSALDTIVRVNPDQALFRVDNSKVGFGWLLATSIQRFKPHTSGYLLSRPSGRGAPVHCGYRLALEDLPKGYYRIANWVFFTRGTVEQLAQAAAAITQPVTLAVGNKRHVNAVVAPPEPTR